MYVFICKPYFLCCRGNKNMCINCLHNMIHISFHSTPIHKHTDVALKYDVYCMAFLLIVGQVNIKL